mmetsp:Transcript_50336/g.146308  ORF Transcript_50336/g.146308 Transcript_50336/m.146308 type:complete len:417 (-) Transcript_50336:687-1937(-)
MLASTWSTLSRFTSELFRGSGLLWLNPTGNVGTEETRWGGSRFDGSRRRGATWIFEFAHFCLCSAISCSIFLLSSSSRLAMSVSRFSARMRCSSCRSARRDMFTRRPEVDPGLPSSRCSCSCFCCNAFMSLLLRLWASANSCWCLSAVGPPLRATAAPTRSSSAVSCASLSAIACRRRCSRSRCSLCSRSLTLCGDGDPGDRGTGEAERAARELSICKVSRSAHLFRRASRRSSRAFESPWSRSTMLSGSKSFGAALAGCRSPSCGLRRLGPSPAIHRSKRPVEWRRSACSKSPMSISPFVLKPKNSINWQQASPSSSRPALASTSASSLAVSNVSPVCCNRGLNLGCRKKSPMRSVRLVMTFMMLSKVARGPISPKRTEEAQSVRRSMGRLGFFGDGARRALNSSVSQTSTPRRC